MLGPRVTAPASKLARSITTSSSAAVPKSAGTILTSSKAATPLARKYAELLQERNIEWDHPRHLTTRSSNIPHPPPKTFRLMQTFTTSAPQEASHEANTIDRMVMPQASSMEGSSGSAFSEVRLPLLPDNFLTQHARDEVDGPIATPEITVVASNPEAVSPSALTEVEGMGVDGVELQFVHSGAEPEREPGMLTNMWRGLVDDVLANGKGGGKLAI